jgi:hypothetical protein
MLTTRIAFAILATTLALPAVAADFMFAADYDGQRIEGRPLYWTKTQIVIQSRDGVLHYLDPKKAENAQRTSPVFEPFGTSEMRAALSEEFGDGFSITSTGHYLVVHRPGESDIWGQRFEQLYRSFQNYFRVRDFSLTEPEFPLVAVIYGSEDEYYEQARLSGHNLPPNTLGHYDPLTNRVLMFDRVDVNDNEWGSTANTLVHEATHQTAFNTGLHSRTAVTPKWVVEGLATMFEARGVYQTGTDAQRRDRINRTRLDDYRHFLPSSSGKHELLELIASDQPFNASAERAYALAWALTFYLNETRPREYEQYLQKIAARPVNSEYPAVERVRDFASVFGKDFGLFESNFRTWMTELE